MSAVRRLSIRDLSIGYADRVVGTNLSLDLESRQILALLGPNGSGKTTLFRTILGLLPQLAGRISVGGDLSALSLRERAKLFGYVPQTSQSFFPYSAREIVLMGRTPYVGALSAPSREDGLRADRAIERLGIGALAERDFSRISGGERQLVLIARALAQEPAFLVMDEPTASLDFANQHRTLHLIRDLAADGLGVVFSTHHPDQALAIATHAVLMKTGGFEATGSAGEVLTSEKLSALFGLELSVEAVAGRLVCVPSGSL